MKLKKLIDSNMTNFNILREICDRCLNTERWQGNVVLMVLDMAFTSVGVSYFNVVVPKIKIFQNEFIKTGRINSLSSLAQFNYKEAFHIWKNIRSWHVACEIAKFLSTVSENDRESLRLWANNSFLENWMNDPVAKIKGVGLISYQYLRMMGGVDTVMPDKIVKKVINDILIQAQYEPVYENMRFIKTVEVLAKKTGYRPIELCWMTWFHENSAKISEMP